MYKGGALIYLTFIMENVMESQTFGSLVRTHYCWSYVFKTIRQETIPAEFILLVSPNALLHLCVSLEKKPLTVIALLHRSP